MKRKLAFGLLWAMPLMLIWSVYTKTLYVNTRPQNPNPQEGRIYSLNVHGTTVYLTRAEEFSADWMFDIGLVVGIAGGLLLRRVEREKRGNPGQQK